jgi:protein-S-isoprenylcysteine O-methyltransferase Ste14
MMAGGLVGLVLARAIVSAAPFVTVLQVFAISLLIWARLTFGWCSFHVSAKPTAGGLITNGPYRFIRHPIYASLCLFAWASSLGHPSALSLTMAMLVSAGAGIRMRAEASLLVERYPEYAAYAARTKRVVPFVF